MSINTSSRSEAKGCSKEFSAGARGEIEQGLQRSSSGGTPPASTGPVGAAAATETNQKNVDGLNKTGRVSRAASLNDFMDEPENSQSLAVCGAGRGGRASSGSCLEVQKKSQQ